MQAILRRLQLAQSCESGMERVSGCPRTVAAPWMTLTQRVRFKMASDVPRTAVLVTDADSPLAEQVVLQLILARYRDPLAEGAMFMISQTY